MRHLSQDELLEAAEDASIQPAHLSACDRCRAEVDRLRQVLADVGSVRVPEPSPLFWDRFATRVGESIRQDASKAEPRRWAIGGTWRMRWRVLVPAGAAICALAILVAALDRHAVSSLHTDSPASPRVAAVQAAPALTGDDESWRVLTEIAAPDTDADAVALVDAPGVAEAAAGELSDEEQGELARLLRAATTSPAPRTQG